jgi:hypothetical protein
MRRPSQISRKRRADIADAAHQLYSLALVRGLTPDHVQADLLRTFVNELTPGEARMYAMGWTVRVMREGLRALATEEGLDASSLGDSEVWRWLRGEVRPRDWLPRMCRLFRCHQAQLGWPAQGSEPAIDYTTPSSAIAPQDGLATPCALPPAGQPDVSDAQESVPYDGAKLRIQLVPISSNGEFITFAVNRRDFLKVVGGGVALGGAASATLRLNGEDQFGFGAMIQAAWPDTRLSAQMHDLGIDWHMVLPSGRSFAGTEIAAHVLGAHRWSNDHVGTSIADAHRLAQFLDVSRRGLAIGAEETQAGHRFFLLNVREARHQLAKRSNIGIPSAYELDDLTYGMLWACANLDNGLQADDAALTRLRRQWFTYARQPSSALSRDAAMHLNSTSQMWLGSDFCARHIFRHMGAFQEVPVFWTCEQKGEEASPWLLFTHKYDYLLKTVAQFRGASPLTRAFCVPESVIHDSPRYERCMFFLAAALMESLGIEVAISAEPDYADVEGFVLAPEQRAIIANWVRSDSMWHVDCTSRHSALDLMSEAVGHAQAHSVIGAASSQRRLMALAGYLDLDWANLSGRCRSLGTSGLSGLLGPQSRLLSVTALDRACSYVGDCGQSTE